eukprot:COSAG04_NODE_380_length_15462_cov_2.388401_8_plen_145_part_00
MHPCQASAGRGRSIFKLKWTQCSRPGKLREVWGSTVPGRNKRAVSAEGKEEMPRLWADHQARLSRSRTDPAGHEHVTDIFIHSSSSSSATHSAIGVTKQPGEKSSCASGRGVTARDRVAVGRRAEVLGVRDLPRGSIVWRVPDV